MKNNPFQPLFGKKGVEILNSLKGPKQPAKKSSSEPQGGTQPPLQPTPQISAAKPLSNPRTLGRLGLLNTNKKTIILVIIVILVLIIIAVFAYKQEQQGKSLRRLNKKLKRLM